MKALSNEGDIEQEIYALRAKIRELDERLRQVNEEAREAADGRDKIHERMKEIKESVRSLKLQRQQLLDQLRSSRAALREVRQRLVSVLLETKSLRGELRGIRLPSDIDKIKRRLDEIDFYLASHRVRREEERRLFEEASRLEALMREYERALRIQDQISGLSPSIDNLRQELETRKAELDELSNRYREINKEMDRLNQEYNEHKRNADELHSRYLKAKETAARLDAERILAVSRLYELQRLIKGSREELVKRRINELKARKKREALEKLSKGEKIDFEELKILLEEEPGWFGV